MSRAAIEMSDDDLENLILADFAVVSGKVFLAEHLSGYRDESNDSIDLLVVPPVPVRVVESSHDDLLRHQDDWVDPCWNVEVLESRPELVGNHGFYVFGTSRDRWGRIEGHRLIEMPVVNEGIASQGDATAAR